MTFRLSSLFIWMRGHALTSACGVAALVVGAGWLAVIRPMTIARASEQSALVEQEQSRDRLERDRAEFERLQNDLASVREDEFVKVDRIVPRGRDVPGLIVELEKLASATGVRLTDVAVTEGAREDEKTLPRGVKAVTLAITVTGADYVATKRFLAAIETHARLLDVQQFTFARGSQAYTVSLRAYYTEE